MENRITPIGTRWCRIFCLLYSGRPSDLSFNFLSSPRLFDFSADKMRGNERSRKSFLVSRINKNEGRLCNYRNPPITYSTVHYRFLIVRINETRKYSGANTLSLSLSLWHKPDSGTISYLPFLQWYIIAARPCKWLQNCANYTLRMYHTTVRKYDLHISRLIGNFATRLWLQLFPFVRRM